MRSGDNENHKAGEEEEIDMSEDHLMAQLRRIFGLDKDSSEEGEGDESRVNNYEEGSIKECCKRRVFVSKCKVCGIKLCEIHAERCGQTRKGCNEMDRYCFNHKSHSSHKASCPVVQDDDETIQGNTNSSGDVYDYDTEEEEGLSTSDMGAASTKAMTQVSHLPRPTGRPDPNKRFKCTYPACIYATNRIDNLKRHCRIHAKKDEQPPPNKPVLTA